MVIIKVGTFGYYDGRRVRPITEADGPQQFDPELEARLVQKGVAEYVCTEAEQEADTVAEEPDSQEETEAEETPVDVDDEQADDMPEYSDDMTLSELKEVAAVYGIDASGMRKKSDIIAAIDAVKAEIDDEEPPQFDAADLV